MRNEKIGFKIREHTLRRVPYMLVCGDKEVESGKVAVRTRRGKDLGSMDVNEVIEKLQQEIRSRSLKQLRNKVLKAENEFKRRALTVSMAKFAPGKFSLTGLEGEQLGIVSLREALEKAEEAGVDLVEISPNAEPPVCRIMDYGKFLYEKSKSSKEQKKKQKVIRLRKLNSVLVQMKATIR